MMKARSALAAAAVVGIAALAAFTGAGCATTGELKQETFAARKRLAGELLVRGDLATAFNYADDLHRERRCDTEVLVLRGVIYREKGMSAEAEADLQEAVRLDDRLAEAHAALGILYDLTHRSEQADAAHRRAVALAPANVRYLNNLGFSLLLRGRTQDAISVFGRAARLDPTDRRLRANLGFAFAATGDLRRAAREAASLDPKSARAQPNLENAGAALGRDVTADRPAASRSADASSGAARGVASFSPRPLKKRTPR